MVAWDGRSWLREENAAQPTGAGQGGQSPWGIYSSNRGRRAGHAAGQPRGSSRRIGATRAKGSRPEGNRSPIAPRAEVFHVKHFGPFCAAACRARQRRCWQRRGRGMRAIWQGEAIAQSDRIETVGGYTYFPRASVRMDLLKCFAKNGERSRMSTRRAVLRSREWRGGEQKGGLVLRGAAGGPAVGRSLDRLLEGCQGDVVPAPPCAGTPCRRLRQVGCGSGGAVRQTPATVQTTAAYLPMQKRLNT